MQSLTVSNVYVGEGSDFSGVPTKMLTVNGSLRFTVHNPASIFGIHVSSTPINLLYSDISVATGQVRNSLPPESPFIIKQFITNRNIIGQFTLKGLIDFKNQNPF